MVGLSKPQGDPSMKEEDIQEESKMIICAITDEFVLKQDICAMCGSVGKNSQVTCEYFCNIRSKWLCC